MNLNQIINKSAISMSSMTDIIFLLLEMLTALFVLLIYPQVNHLHSYSKGISHNTKDLKYFVNDHETDINNLEIILRNTIGMSYTVIKMSLLNI